MVVLLATAVVACTEDAPYRTEEVVAAFQRHDYALEELRFPDESVAAEQGDLLTPGGGRPAGQPFVVIVASEAEAEADEAWPEYESVLVGDEFAARRANVVVVSNGSFLESDRRRVLAALRSLPDRGADVQLAGANVPATP
jgi:hypothetical protein